MREYSEENALLRPIEVQLSTSNVIEESVMVVPWLGLYIKGSREDKIVEAALEESRYGGLPGKLVVNGDVLGSRNIKRVLPLVKWNNFEEFCGNICDEAMAERARRQLEVTLLDKQIHAGVSNSALITIKKSSTSFTDLYKVSIADYDYIRKYSIRCRLSYDSLVFKLNRRSLMEV